MADTRPDGFVFIPQWLRTPAASSESVEPPALPASEEPELEPGWLTRAHVSLREIGASISGRQSEHSESEALLQQESTDCEHEEPRWLQRASDSLRNLVGNEGAPPPPQRFVSVDLIESSDGVTAQQSWLCCFSSRRNISAQRSSTRARTAPSL